MGENEQDKIQIILLSVVKQFSTSVCTDTPSCTHGDQDGILDKVLSCSWFLTGEQTEVSQCSGRCGGTRYWHILQEERKIASRTQPELLLCSCCEGNVSSSPKGDYNKKADPDNVSACLVHVLATTKYRCQPGVHQDHGPACEARRQHEYTHCWHGGLLLHPCSAAET